MHLLAVFTKVSINFDYTYCFLIAFLFTVVINVVRTIITERLPYAVTLWLVSIFIAEILLTGHHFPANICGWGIITGTICAMFGPIFIRKTFNVFSRIMDALYALLYLNS